MASSTFDNFTLIVPTFKRYTALLRLLKFYQYYKYNVKILVLDSTPYAPDNYELRKMLSQENVKWEKIDHKITFIKKVAKSAKFIDTDYAALCADDDLIIPSAIAKCIAFLENNQDYSSSHGLYFLNKSLGLTEKKDFSISQLYPKEVRTSSQNTGSDRVMSYLCGQTSPPFYAVQRSEDFFSIWHETSSYVSDAPYHPFAELFPCCLSLTFGKMKVLPVFYAYREPNTFSTLCNQKNELKKSYSVENVKKFVEGVGKHISKVDRVSLEEAKRLVSKGIEIERYRTEKELVSPQSINSVPYFIQLLKIVKHKLKIRTRAKILYYYLRYQGCPPSIYDEHLEDFKHVRETVFSAGLTPEDLNEPRKYLSNQKGKD